MTRDYHWRNRATRESADFLRVCEGRMGVAVMRLRACVTGTYPRLAMAGRGTSGAPPPPRLRFATPRSPAPQRNVGGGCGGVARFGKWTTSWTWTTSGTHPRARPPAPAAATRRATRVGLTSNSTVQPHTPSAELHLDVCSQCGSAKPSQNRVSGADARASSPTRSVGEVAARSAAQG